MLRHFVSVWIHRMWVNWYLLKMLATLFWRGQTHDLSKYGPHERARFAKALPILSDTTYGSDEYEHGLRILGPALAHHYAVNPHHPEHYEEGVRGMDLYDFLEMYADWQAAIRRHDDGDLRESIRKNAEEYDLDPQMVHLLANTAVKDGH